MNHSNFKDNEEGHFDMLSLSVYEGSKNALKWRENIDRELHQKYTPIAIHHDPKLLLDKKVTSDDFVAHLTSVHEQDHFTKHCGSEYGIFITYLYNLKYLALIGYWKAINNDKSFNKGDQASTIREINKLLEILISHTGDYTQEQAVDAVNEFFHKLGINSNVLVTSEPNRPHCSDRRYSYHKILEASAVISQLSCFDLYPDKQLVSQYLHSITSRENNELYGELAILCNSAVYNYTPAASIALSLSLDVRVPFLGSEFKEPIEWSDFHPSYRLAKILPVTQNCVKTLGLDTPQFNKFPHAMYSYTPKHATLLGTMKMLMGNDVITWADSSSYNYDSTLIGVLSNLPASRILANLTTSSTAYSLNYIYEAYNKFKKLKLSNPVQYFSGSTLFITAEDKEYLGKSENNIFLFPSFSLFDKKVDSVYLRDNFEMVINCFSLYFKSYAIKELIYGKSKSKLVAELNNNYSFGYKEFNKYVFESVELSMEKSFKT